MDKIEAATGFLMGLQMSLNNAAYFRGHPYLTKSAENFKEKIETMFGFLEPLEVEVFAESISFAGKAWNKPAMVVDMARALHQRKIKTILISRGVTLEEMLGFLNAASLSVKDTVKGGGIKKLLSTASLTHIQVREVDYSYLLEASAEECQELLSAFGDPAQEKDPKKLNEFSSNFGVVLGKFKDNDLLLNEDLKRNINNFLQYLGQSQKEKFEKCAKEVYRSVSKYKAALEGAAAEKAAELFKNLKEQDLARLLMDELATSDNFDVLSFQFFSRIAGEKRNKAAIAESLLDLGGSDTLKENPRVAKNIQNLLSGADNQSISDVYRNTLSSLLKKVTLGQGKAFDRASLELNYRHMLLGLLGQEKDRGKLKTVTKKLTDAWPNIAAEKDWGYIKELFLAIQTRKKAEPEAKDIFSDLGKNISILIEGLAWEGEDDPALAYFIDNLESASLDAQFYLDKIFKEYNTSPLGLRLFIRFFPGKVAAFCDLLAGERFNTDFILKAVEGLKKIDSLLVFGVLKYLYPLSDQIIKIEILRSMRQFTKIDEEFLFSVLTSEEPVLRKEAAFVLARDEAAKEKLLGVLLDIKSPWGLKNRMIIDNMGFVEEAGLKDARGRLLLLSKRHFFWNRELRIKAREILDKWQA